MPHPVDPGADFKRWTRGLESVSVKSVNPDTGAVEETSAGVSALRSVLLGAEQPVGEGAVGYDQLTFVFAAEDVSFVPKVRDLVTDALGVTYDVGNVKTEAFGKLYRCSECVRVRGE